MVDDGDNGIDGGINGGTNGGTNGATGKQPARPRTVLNDISSRAWEHPADKGALVALRKLKGFDTVLKALSGLVNERAVRLELLGSAIRADERQFPALYRQLADVARVLDAPQVPELF